MDLSSELILELVKTTNTGSERTKDESTMYGTIVEYDGDRYVQIDGSELLTPISTTADVKPGERVTVMIKNHSATVTGNISSPSASSNDLKEAEGKVEDQAKKISEFEVVLADKVDTAQLNAQKARIDELVAEDVKIRGELEAYKADIDELVAEDLKAQKALIDDLEATKLDASVADITFAKVADLEATNIEVNNLSAAYGTFESATTKKLEAVNATIESLDASYANIDFSNIGEAAIEKIFSETGLIKDLVVGDGTITGELVGVTIKGDLIEGNTVKADKLVVKGSDGLYYKLNFEAGTFAAGEEVPTDSLHGSVITAKSVTADRISVTDLVAFGATIGGFKITENSIYSDVKSTVDNTTRGIYFDNDGQMAFGDATNFVKFYKTPDGSYKLAISADSLIFSTSGKTVEETVSDELLNIEVGARNLIRNSSDLIFEDYTFEDAAYAVTYDGNGNTVVQSNAITVRNDNSGNVGLQSSILTCSDDGSGNVMLMAIGDEDSGETATMKSLTIGGVKFEIVDEKARTDIGMLDDLLTSDKSNLVAAINEIYKTGGGSGGGGSDNNAELSLANTTGWLYKTLSLGSACVLSAKATSLEGGLPTGPLILKVTVNNVTKSTSEIAQGDFTIDVGPWLDAGACVVKLNVTDVYGNSRTINFNITAVRLVLASTFDAATPYTGDISYTYTPTGSSEKTVHFLVDGKEIGTSTVLPSGRQQSFTIPAQKHGNHNFEVYFDAIIDGEPVESNHLRYDIMCLEDGNTTPIISVPYWGTTVEQFDLIAIPFIVYNPASLTSDIVQTANGKSVAELTVDRTQQTWSYRPDTAGALKLTITCGEASRDIDLTVNASSINVQAETEALSLYFSTYGRSNNEADPSVWESGSIAATLTGFNWASDGWQTDADGVTALRVSGDARVEIPYQIFAQDFRTTGKTIEIEFATRNVLNYDAEVITCYANNRGLKVTAQRADINSEQSAIGTQYKEEEHVRLAFVIEKRTNHRLLMVYINGILSGAVQYPADDDFSQANPVGISIGSNDCTTDIYCIRVYDNDLTRYQILDNWIADTQLMTLKAERYQRNNVYDDYGKIIIAKLPSDLPYLVLNAAKLPEYKGNKITVGGSYTDPNDQTKSFSITGAEADVQGTSSAGYARKNYKIKFKGGFTQNGKVNDDYQLGDAVPTNVFTFKADVASSEGANNVELVRLYNEISPYRTPPQLEDARVRQGIDGHPIVIFHNNGAETVFIGKYNFNHDKGTPEVFGLADGDESWEIRNNTSDRVRWKDADFSGTDWLNDFEARHPEDNTDVDNLKALAEWLVSTDTDQATGNALTPAVTYGEVEYTHDTAEYRLAKFDAELSDWLEEDSTIFYYLFTELFLMVDSRAKNAFPTLYADGKWCWLPYDMDTAIGINNEGALAFGYELEDIDTVGDATVYNGQDSVIWRNLRATRFEQIKAMYQELRSDELLSYDDVNRRFEVHQMKWPEAIFNEDAYYKYLEPLFVEGTSAYLSMLQGSKAEQRKWWLYNRFRYIDSKYNAGDALKDFITLRGYAKSDITVTPYADVYATIKFGSYLVQKRALRGSSYVMECPLDTVNDTETYIYSASQIAAIGDLSGYKVGYAEFSKGTKLQSIKLGDASPDYSNPNLNELYLGNNVLLQTLDIRNCPNLGTGEQKSVDISGCTNIEYVYFDGTAIAGLTLPNGGILKTLHLPGTVANLTIRNQTALTEFVMPSYSNITTLWLEGVGDVIPGNDILLSMAAGSRVRLVDVNWTLDSHEVLDRLLTMRGMTETSENTDTAVVSGTFHFDTTLPVSKYLICREKFPYLTITAKSFDLDVLEVSPAQVFVTSDNKLFMLADGGYSTKYTGAEIDQYIDTHITYSEEE